MGGKVSINVNVDSPSAPGEKSILTDAIDGVTPEQLMEAMQKYIRDGKTVMGRETSFEATETDDGILCVHHWVIPDFLGGGEYKLRILYKSDTANRQIECVTFFSDKLFERKESPAIGVFKVLQDPVRIESWTTVNDACRLAGLLQKNLLEKALKGMGVPTNVQTDQLSPTDPSKLCLLSDPIESEALNADTYLDVYTKWLVDSAGATELPDSSFIEERAGWGSLFGVDEKVYAQHFVDKKENRLCIYDFGNDDKLQTIVSKTHLQVLRDPFRVEQYNQRQAGRRAGDEELKAAKPFIEGVLEALQKGS